MYANIRTHTSSKASGLTGFDILTYLPACQFACLHTYIHTYTYLYTTHIYICRCRCRCRRRHTHTQMYIYIIYIYTHTHIHTVSAICVHGPLGRLFPRQMCFDHIWVWVETLKTLGVRKSRKVPATPSSSHKFDERVRV